MAHMMVKTRATARIVSVARSNRLASIRVALPLVSPSARAPNASMCHALIRWTIATAPRTRIAIVARPRADRNGGPATSAAGAGQLGGGGGPGAAMVDAATS